MDPTDILNANDQQPENPAAPTEPAPEAPAAAESSTADVIAAALIAAPEAQAEEAEAASVAEAEKAPQTDEEKAKAEEDRLEAEAKAFGLTKPDTTAKFKELSRAAARAKELEPLETEVQELRQTVAQQQEVFDHLERNGINGEQFGEAVMVLSFMNSGDPVRMQRAYDTLSQQVAALGKQLGLEAPGVDPLADHPDLQHAVEGMEIDRKHALELAHARKMKAATIQHSSQQGQALVAQQEQQRVVQELTALEQQLRASDPQFAAKWQLLRPTLLPLLSQLPLNMRANAFREAYAAFQLPAAPVAPAQTRPDPANPGRPAMAAGAKAPTNTAEAIMLGMKLG